MKIIKTEYAGTPKDYISQNGIGNDKRQWCRKTEKNVYSMHMARA